MGHCPAMFVGFTGVLPSQDAVVSIRDLPISMCPQYTCACVVCNVLCCACVCVLLYNNTVIYNILICIYIHTYIFHMLILCFGITINDGGVDSSCTLVDWGRLVFTYVISMSSLFRQLKGDTNAPGGLITTWATRQEKVVLSRANCNGSWLTWWRLEQTIGL